MCIEKNLVCFCVLEFVVGESELVVVVVMVFVFVGELVLFVFVFLEDYLDEEMGFIIDIKSFFKLGEKMYM